MSNFAFIETRISSLYPDAKESEKKVYTDPRTGAFYARRCLEHSVKWVFEHDNSLTIPYNDNLVSMIQDYQFQQNLPHGMGKLVDFIRRLGNDAAHGSGNITINEAMNAVKYLFYFLNWIVNTYTKNPPGKLQFDETFIPKKGEKAKSRAEFDKLKKEIDDRDALLEEEKRKNIQQQTEIEKLKQKLKEFRLIKNENVSTSKSIDYVENISEAETRELYIDLLLKEAGWNPNTPDTREYEVKGMPNETGLGYVDYVLWGDNGKPLGIVEAKRTTKSPKQGQHQAELYADCLEEMTGQRPIIFYTNGYETWMWDDTFYPPRKVFGFYTKDELSLLIDRRTMRKDLQREDINKDIASYSFQKEAIKRVAESFSEKKRKALLIMATGSGKTRTAIAIVELLSRCNWIKRVLFLADRTALLNQAKKNFTAHLPHYNTVDITKDKENISNRIVFSTYPTMMNLIDDTRTDGQKTFSPGHFDLIIIDEAHRSVFLKYRFIFEYFDALLLGLTATPKTEVDKNTYRLFDLQNNLPTFSYELEQAVSDGYLVPPKAISVPLKFPREGIKYDDLSEEDKEQFELTFWEEDDEEMPVSLNNEKVKQIDADALNTWLFNNDTVDKVLGYLMTNGLKVEGGDKLGKTIIFAKNHKHALHIEERFNHNFPQLKGKFLSIIDNHITYAQDEIDNFENKKNINPFIAVSVDMLDTGIDVPQIVNLVFFKRVKSKTKFWQMIGRGTRLCKNLFGSGLDKQHFYIFDFCENFEFFKAKPDGIETKLAESLSQKIFKRSLLLTYILQKSQYQQDDRFCKLYEDIKDKLYKQIAGINTESILVRPVRRQLDKYVKKDCWKSLSEEDVNIINESLSDLIIVADNDEDARRFDLLCISYSLALEENLPSKQYLMNAIMRIAEQLDKKANITLISQQIDLIKLLQDKDYWKNANVVDIENVRLSIRELVKFIDKTKGQEDVYTDFEDSFIGDVTEHSIIKPDANLAEYKKNVEKYLREHSNHIAISKLKTNKPLTKTDILELEKILFQGELGSKEDFEKAYGSNQPLGIFIRNIVGLDRASAKHEFEEFLNKGNLTANQIQFIDNIINHLCENGIIEPSVLYEKQPFTNFHVHGIAGVFPSDEPKILDIIEGINKNAGIA